MTVADGTGAEVVCYVEDASVSCASLFMSLIFKFVGKAPFDAIIGNMTLDCLQANLDYGRQQVTLSVEKREALLSLLTELPMMDETITDR